MSSSTQTVNPSGGVHCDYITMNSRHIYTFYTKSAAPSHNLVYDEWQTLATTIPTRTVHFYVYFGCGRLEPRTEGLSLPPKRKGRPVEGRAPHILGFVAEPSAECRARNCHSSSYLLLTLTIDHTITIWEPSLAFSLLIALLLQQFSTKPTIRGSQLKSTPTKGWYK